MAGKAQESQTKTCSTYTMSDVLYSNTKPRINLFINVSINIIKFYDMIVVEIIKITSVLTDNLKVNKE